MDRPGVVSRVSRCRTRVAMQLICPCLIGRKDLMTRSYPAADGDTANAGSDKSLHRDAGHDTSSRN